jgi:TonB family protein
MRILSAATGTMYRHMVVPKYPKEALRSGYEGRVWLRVDYDGRGEVVAVAPMAGRLPVDPSLTQAAVDAVKSWSFEPEKVGGYDRRGAAIVPICFKLRPDEEICRSNPLQKPEGMSAFANGNGPISVDSVVSVDMGSGNQMP